APSIALFGQDWQGEELDAFLAQRLGLLGGRFAVDAAGGRLLVMDLARFLAKTRADILGIGLDLGSEPAHGGGELAMGGDALRVRALLRLLALLCRAGPCRALGDPRRHQRLADLVGRALRTGQLTALRLRIEGAAAGEPRLEFVALRAPEAIEDHGTSL